MYLSSILHLPTQIYLVFFHSWTQNPSTLHPQIQFPPASILLLFYAAIHLLPPPSIQLSILSTSSVCPAPYTSIHISLHPPLQHPNSHLIRPLPCILLSSIQHSPFNLLIQCPLSTLPSVYPTCIHTHLVCNQLVATHPSIFPSSVIFSDLSFHLSTHLTIHPVAFFSWVLGLHFIRIRLT